MSYLCKHCKKGFDVYYKRNGHAIRCVENPKRNEAIEKHRKKMIGHATSEETRRKIGLAHVGNKWGLGHKHSDETKRKIGEANAIANLGNKHSEESKKKIGLASLGNQYAKGLKHTNDWKVEMRLKMLGNKFGLGKNMGEKHHNWKGGISGNPKYNSFRVRMYKQKKIGHGGVHTLEQWEELKAKYSYMCLCCKRMEPEIKLTEDHIIPVYHGGSNDISNIQPLCINCNARKKVKTIYFSLNRTEINI